MFFMVMHIDSVDFMECLKAVTYMWYSSFMHFLNIMYIWLDTLKFRISKAQQLTFLFIIDIIH